MLFLGAHLDRLDEEIFDSMSFRFEGLEVWLAKKAFEETRDQGSTIARHEFPEQLDIPIADDDLSIRLELRFSSTGDNYRTLNWRRDAAFRFVASAAHSQEWFMQRMAHLRALLGLLTGEPTCPTSITGFVSDEPGRPLGVGIYFPVVGALAERTFNPGEMAFSRTTLGDRLPGVVQAWFAKRELLTSTLGLLFGTLYRSDFPSDFQFLALTQALETFHRRTRGGEYLLPDEYEPVRSALVAAIPHGIPPDLRSALKSRIEYGNEFSQRRRFKELLDSLGTDRDVVTKDADFIGSVVEQRNYLTHLPAGTEPTMTPGEMFYASMRLRTLLIVLLLLEVGIDGAEAAEGLRRTRWHRGFVGT